MKNIRLIAMDMDGTLLNTQHETTPFTRDALARAADAGCALALCTGRCLSELREHLSTLPMVQYVIGENGACVYDVRDKRFIDQIAIPDSVSQSILEALKGRNAILQAFLRNTSYMQCSPDQDLSKWHIEDFKSVFLVGSTFVDDLPALCERDVEKINAYFASQEEKRRFLDHIKDLPIQTVDSIGIGVEMSPIEATKGRGLRALCEHLGIIPTQAMAIGDGSNDIEMMKAAGYAVAMGNAIEEVKALADKVTEDCDHDGAARSILDAIQAKNIIDLTAAD